MNEIRQQKLAALLALALIPAVPAFAAEDDAFKFTVSQGFYHDSNLYRLPDSKDMPAGWSVPKDKRSDTYSVTRAGVSFDREYSRQGLHAALSVGRTVYREHKNLDNTSPDAKLRWDWRIGDRWSGVLGYNYNESFVGFDQIRGSNERVIRRLGRATFGADFWFHPDWAVGASFANVNNDYRDSKLPWNKYRANEENLNITYRPTTGSRLVLSLRNEDGEYPNRKKKDELYPYDMSSTDYESYRDWNQRDLRLSGEWALSGVSRLSGYIGYTQREYDLAPHRDFRGVTGRIAFHWVPTSKLIFDLAWRREVGADIDAVANYAVTQGWTFQPGWMITDKVRLGANFDYLSRDYGGDPGPVQGITTTDKRDERGWVYGLSLQYQPTVWANLAIGIQRDKRDSKHLDYLDYRAQTTWLSGNFSF